MDKLIKLRCFGCIIFDDKLEKVLLVHSITKNSSRNTSFTKGGKKPKETPIECAIRETKEESGITEDYLSFANGKYVIEKSAKGNDSIGYFICKLCADYTYPLIYDPTEIEEIKWYSIPEVNRLFFGNRKIAFTNALLLAKNSEFVPLDFFTIE